MSKTGTLEAGSILWQYKIYPTSKFKEFISNGPKLPQKQIAQQLGYPHSTI